MNSDLNKSVPGFFYFAEIFPGREWVPKTLIFAKDDAGQTARPRQLKRHDHAGCVVRSTKE